MNENASYAFDFSPRPNWNLLAAGPLTLRGIFVAKECGPVLDLRVVVSGRRYLARHGLISPESAARWPDQPRALYSGCEFDLAVGPEDRVLEFEFLSRDLQWVQFWRRKILVNPLTLRAQPRPRLNLDCLPALLQRQLQESLGQSGFAAGHDLPELIRQATFAPDSWVPAPPLHAALDQPVGVAISRYHGVQACGWVFHETLRIRRVYGTAGVADFYPVNYGMPQEGVARHYAHFPHAKNTMLLGIFPLPPRQANPASVRIYVELEDGSHHLVLAQRFWHTPLADAELPLPADRLGRFLTAVGALHETVEACGVDPGSWRNFLSAARRARKQLRDWFSVQDGPHPWAVLPPHERQQSRQRPGARGLRQLYQAEQERQGALPGLALLALVSERDCSGLARLVRSLKRQVLRRWELVVAPQDETAHRAARAASRIDGRVRVIAPGQLAMALAELRGDYLGVVDPAAELAPDALFRCAEAAAGQEPPALVYTDEETVDANGKVTPWAWPDWSPALALTGALGRTLAFVSRRALDAAGGLDLQAGPAAGLDALLRVGLSLPDAAARHVVTYGQRRPERAIPPENRSAVAAAISAAVARRGMEAQAVAVDFPEPAGHCWMRLQWSPDYLARQPVTIVIPTRDRLDLLQRCVQRLEQTVDWRHARLIIVDDGSREPKAVRYLEQLAQRTDLPVRVIPGGEASGPFNYSRLVNLGTAAAETPLVLHLNNDVDALVPGWLEELAGWFAFGDTGAVGAKLVYADGRINHAGIVLDATEALPLTPFEGAGEATAGHPQYHRLARDVSAVIGACLLTRTDLYRRLGGFNEREFGVAYNDVDYCLRLRAAGHRVIYSPGARLVHWGSESRGRSFHESEHLAYVAAHGGRTDPFLNPQLKLAARTLVPDLERAVAGPARASLRLLVATHNLGLEGAPLFLFEFVEHAVKSAGFTVDLVAFADGPLRARYEALGVTIKLVDRHPIHASGNPAEYAERVAAVKRDLDLSRVDLVVTNTVVGFWVIELARQAGLPSLWFIHESARVPRFFAHEVRPGMQRVVHAAFRQATRVVFLCEATRRYYDEDNIRDHFRILPGWVDAARIRKFCRAHSRQELRRKHGIGDNEKVILNVGTICERKGQRWFLAAARRLAQLHPGPLRFLMVGGLGDLYQDIFATELAGADFPAAQVVGKTEEVYDFYGLADLAVCTSFEESFPRVLLEAMAFGLPVVSTNVHGVPDIIADRAEGLLVEPGDVEALARTMDDALRQSATPNSLAPLALSKVLRRFDRARLLPRHLALAREAAMG